jgi:hypothetical protein
MAINSPVLQRIGDILIVADNSNPKNRELRRASDHAILGHAGSHEQAVEFAERMIRGGKA